MSLPRVNATLFRSRGVHHAIQFCHTRNEPSSGPEEFAQRQLATDADIVLRHRKLVVDRRIVHHQEDGTNRISIEKLGLFVTLLLKRSHSLVSHGQHVIPSTEVHGPSGAGLDTCRKKAIPHPVETHGAFGYQASAWILPGYIVWT